MSERDVSQLAEWDFAIAGFTSGLLTRFISQPLDVLKIRFQLQVEPIRRHRHGKYKGMLQCGYSILKEERLFSLWKGHVPGQILSITYGVVQFETFEVISMKLKSSHRFSDSSCNFMAGSMAGGLATLVAYPWDTLRTRLAAQPEPKTYTGTIDGITKMYRAESLRGFYKGFFPTLLQIIPQSGIQFMTYRNLKAMLHNKTAHSDLESLMCGAGAGAFAKFVVFPLDLLKKRIQIIGFESARNALGRSIPVKQSSLTYVAGMLWQLEGPWALYKGVLPSTFKAGITSALTFFFYEQSCAFLRKYKKL